MSPKSAIMRLQVILLIDLIVVASAAAGYYYIATLPAPDLSPSDIQLANLQATPSTAQIGDEIGVSFNVTNIGPQAGTYPANLMLDGAQIQSRSVLLAAGETKTVEFTITGAAEGVHLVGVGDAEASFVVLGYVELSDLGVNRTEAKVGEAVGITAKVTNVSPKTQSYSFTITINGEAVETKTGQLNPNETGNLLFEVTEQNVGTYNFKVGSLEGTFTVAINAEPPKPAEFQVTDLLVDPAVTQPGTKVTVTAQVTNVGEVSGSYTAEFLVNEQVRSTQTVQLAGGESTTVTFSTTENVKGSYTVAIGNAIGGLTVQDPAQIDLTELAVSPDEAWGGQSVTVSAKATNRGESVGSLQLKVNLDGQLQTSRTITLAPKSFITASLTFTAPDLLGGDSMSHNLDLNGIRAAFVVVKDGYHTLSVDITPSGDAEFTVTGPPGVLKCQTPYSALLPVGTYTVTMPASDPTGKASWLGWSDKSTSFSKTVTLSAKVMLFCSYSRGSSCPSLYTWNGTAYSFVTDVSNHGWLGYIKSINSDGSITYYRNNPWDYIPIDRNQLAATNGYYNLTLLQRYNEIFYTDQAYMVVVDHPANVNVYSTMVEEYLDPAYMGKLYTIGNPQPPVSAVNERGENILPQISSLDGIFNTGGNGLLSPAWNNTSWNTLTLNLGTLAEAKQVKLVVRAVVDWGSPDDYTVWLDKFFAQPVPDGTEVTPPPFMEVKNAQGNWVQIPMSREFPLPPDGVPRTYVIDLTGLFPTNDYSLRINNFWNVTFDFIGVDTTSQQAITVQRIQPKATLYQSYAAGTAAATGSFTKYGDVTPLLMAEDDMFVIGRQGDALSLQFPVDGLAAPAPGMARDYFLYEASWFKDETGNWGFGFGFTVDPLPFRSMSGFPYQPTESYPNDTTHQNYLTQWNTRVIAKNASDSGINESLLGAIVPSTVLVVPILVLNAKIGTTVLWGKTRRREKACR